MPSAIVTSNRVSRAGGASDQCGRHTQAARNIAVVNNASGPPIKPLRSRQNQ